MRTPALAVTTVLLLLGACAAPSGNQINTPEEAEINALESMDGGQSDTRIDQTVSGEI